MKSIIKDIKKQSLVLTTGAMAFVAGLMWRDAITEWLKPIIESGEGAMTLTVVAIAVTLIAVVFTLVLTKLFGPMEDNK